MNPMRPQVAAEGGRPDSAGPLPVGHQPSSVFAGRRRSDSVRDTLYRWSALACGGIVVAIVALIALFLVIRATPSIVADQANFFTSSDFSTNDPQTVSFGIRDLLTVTLLSSLVALLLAVPTAMGIAIFLTRYAPRRVARTFGALVDLVAAVPSIVFGLWGILILAPILEPVAEWLNTNAGWIPLFASGNVSIQGGGTIFTASIVLAIMILPIITSVTREAYRQTPQSTIEAAEALGATRWEVVRMVVIPFGRSGTIAGAMLGLGRALGETIAVLLILRASPKPASWTLFDGGYTFASKIASGASEFSAPLPAGAYIAAGLVLFVLTFIVNAFARFAARPRFAA